MGSRSRPLKPQSKQRRTTIRRQRSAGGSDERRGGGKRSLYWPRRSPHPERPAFNSAGPSVRPGVTEGRGTCRTVREMSASLAGPDGPASLLQASSTLSLRRPVAPVAPVSCPTERLSACAAPSPNPLPLPRFLFQPRVPGRLLFWRPSLGGTPARGSLSWQQAGHGGGLFSLAERAVGGGTARSPPPPPPRSLRRLRRSLPSARPGEGAVGLASGTGMAAGGGGAPSVALWALLLALPAATAIKAHKEVELDFFQETLPSGKESGEFLQSFDQEEVFHVDWAQKQNVWRLPAFARQMSFEVQGALGNLAVLKNNLGIMRKRSNQTRAQNVSPSATVYPENPVELGEPNVLVCFVDQFSPPVLNITWLKNGQVVSEGVQETGFLSSVEYTFRKFSYLPFVPEEGDFYACQVDHWGLRESLIRPWDPKLPPPASETPEDVLCGLGLTFGILGVIAGPILFFKARKMDRGI